MPPSAGACQTIDAAEKPDCGRAGARSSIITAIGRCAATARVTIRPVSGAGTSAGVGVGVGAGVAVGEAPGPDDCPGVAGLPLPEALGAAEPPGPMAPAVPEPPG